MKRPAQRQAGFARTTGAQDGDEAVLGGGEQEAQLGQLPVLAADEGGEMARAEVLPC